MNGYKGISVSNIPTHNLREQFFNHYHMVKSQEFQEAISNWEPGKHIVTPYVAWFYWPDQFMTFLTQLSIVGLESYICAAAFHELGMRGRLKENIEYIRNPFSIPGEKGTASKYYNLMPTLIDESIPLSTYDSSLWGEVKAFYKEVRNPLFHGKQLERPTTRDLITIFELLASIYAWIDGWHDPNQIIPGSGWFTNLHRE